MGYKFKPNKSVAKRFRVTGTGKLKRAKGFHTHLMSARDAKKSRDVHRDAILPEGHARNMREMMGLKKLKPAKVAHDRKVRAAKAAKKALASAAAGK
jgi:large subunit ribosomal protein L35